MYAPLPALPPLRPAARWSWRGALLVAGLAPLLALAQTQAATSTHDAVLRRFYYRTIGIEQGLAESMVNVLLQDHAGYVWIGGDSKLQRYDGYDFVDFAQVSGRDGPLRSPISALAEDARHRLWVGTYDLGLLRLSPGRQTLDVVALAEPVPRTASGLLADQHDGMWISTEQGIVLVDGDTDAVRQRWSLTDGAGAPPLVRGMAHAGDGSVWVAATNGLWRVQAGTAQAQHVAAAQLRATSSVIVDGSGQVRIGTSDGLYGIDAHGDARRLWPTDGAYAVTAIAADAQQRLWLGVAGHGIAIFDAARDHVHWSRPDPMGPGRLPDGNITTLMPDRSGLLWIGTHNRGLVRTDMAGAPFRYLFDRAASVAAPDGNNVQALAGDADGALWVGLASGLKHYLPERNQFEAIERIKLVAADGSHDLQGMPDVAAIAQAPDARLWLATDRGLGLFDPRASSLSLLDDAGGAAGGLAAARPYCLATGANGRLWVGTLRGGLARYDSASGQWTRWRHNRAQPNAESDLGSNTVFAVHEDRQGRLWAGTVEGLSLIDPVSGKVQVSTYVAGDPNSLSASTVLALHESARGELWVGTASGLNRFDGLDGGQARFSHWPQGNDRASAIYSIEEDGRGRLWLGTNRGMASFDPATNSWHDYGITQGVQGTAFNPGASTVLRDGEFAFGGSDGINLFQPDAIGSDRAAAPVVVTAVRVGANEAIVQPADGTVRMAAGEHVVRFEFAALDYAAPERNRFAYQLEGFDTRWSEAGTRHDATYTNLEPGHYVFHVRGTNRDGYWSPQLAAVELEVLPPWWESAPARLGYLLAALGVAALAWRWQRQRRREELLHHHDLRDREDRLRLALWGSGDDFWDWDMSRDHIVLTGSHPLSTGDDVHTDKPFRDWFRERVHPDDLALTEQRLDNHARGDTQSYEAEYRLRFRRGDGHEWRWILARGRIVERDASGRPLRMCGTTRDITAERIAAQERRISHEILRSMGEAVVVNDLDFRVTMVNPAFTRITGWTQAEVEGQSIAVLDCARHPSEIYQQLRTTLEATGQWHGELWQRRKTGEEFLSWCEVSEVRDATGTRTHYVGVISDITDRKRAEQELRYLANYDALTGLPNRSLLLERIHQGIGRAQRGQRKLAVLFLDLDRFKHVNDSMGHAAGDSLLRAAGARLRHIVRGNDSVARIGGDEFTVVLEDLESGADAEVVASKILAAFEEPLELDNGQEVVISPSIGISLHPDHGQTANDLLKYADTAMYQAKERGRHTWMVYVEAMDAAARLRAMTVAALRRALERNEFHLRYQPKMSLHDDRISGFEALLRWHNAELGDIAPGVFIPIAEETGLIVDIGDWVIEQACRQLARWRAEGLVDITLSINLSVAQLLHADLVRRLSDMLAAHDVAPAQLELELTESIVMANAEQSITTLRRLKAVGVSLAIDDFGTGYSSLSYLKRLPIDALKIDKEFVGDLTTDPDDEAITATVIAMAHSLALNVIAEGVEQVAQVDYLRRQDCDEIQGHWLAEPMLPELCLPFVREHERRRRERGVDAGPIGR